MESSFKTIDEYILLFPEDVQKKLYDLRRTIHDQHSGIEEYIGYQMPAFRYKGKPLVYFAAYKKHIGLYPEAEAIVRFENDFIKRKYKFSKGAVQFPINEGLPSELIISIVQFRIKEINHKKS